MWHAMFMAQSQARFQCKAELPHVCRYSVCNAHPEGGPDFATIPGIKKRFLRLHGVIDFREFLVGWFHGAPFEVGLCSYKTSMLNPIRAILQLHGVIDSRKYLVGCSRGAISEVGPTQQLFKFTKECRLWLRKITDLQGKFLRQGCTF